MAQVAAEIAVASDRAVRYVPVSLEEHAAEAAEHGVPPEVVDLLTYLFSEVVDGRNADTTDGVRRALGREPRDFARLRPGDGRQRRLERLAGSAGLGTMSDLLRVGPAKEPLYEAAVRPIEVRDRLSAARRTRLRSHPIGMFTCDTIRVGLDRFVFMRCGQALKSASAQRQQ